THHEEAGLTSWLASISIRRRNVDRCARPVAALPWSATRRRCSDRACTIQVRSRKAVSVDVDAAMPTDRAYDSRHSRLIRPLGVSGSHARLYDCASSAAGDDARYE